MNKRRIRCLDLAWLEQSVSESSLQVLRAQLELNQVRQEIDRRISEKEEEFENSRFVERIRFIEIILRKNNSKIFVSECRKNHARAMDSIQASLDSEQRAKAEALRIKKKLEGDINELEIALDHANKANIEAQKAIKR